MYDIASPNVDKLFIITPIIAVSYHTFDVSIAMAVGAIFLCHRRLQSSSQSPWILDISFLVGFRPGEGFGIMQGTGR